MTDGRDGPTNPVGHYSGFVADLDGDTGGLKPLNQWPLW